MSDNPPPEETPEKKQSEPKSDEEKPTNSEQKEGSQQNSKIKLKNEVQPVEYKPAISQEALQQELDKLKQENELLQTWSQCQKQLQQKYKSKSDAFKALDKNQSGMIEKEEFNEELGEQEKKEELFNLIKKSEGDGLNQEDWTNGWVTLISKFEENNHRIDLMSQKLEIIGALQSDQVVSNNKRLEYYDQGMNIKMCQIEYSNNYYLITIPQFRNTNSLDDFSNIFNQFQPQEDKERYEEQYYQQPQESQIIFELRPDSHKERKGLDIQLSQYKTPNKTESRLGSFNKASYFNQQQPQAQQQPTYPKFDLTSKQQASQPSTLNTNPFNSKNLQRRKEDLFNHMGKLGLGSKPSPIAPATNKMFQANPTYESPSYNAHRQNLERIKNMIGSKDYASNTQAVQARPPPITFGNTTTIRRDSSQNLFQDILGNTSLNQVKYKRQEVDQSTNRSSSTGRDSYNLTQQSLQNYTNKLIHNHKYGQASPSTQLSTRSPGRFQIR